MEKELVLRAGCPYRAVDAGQVRGMSPWALARNAVKLWHGYRQARQLFIEWPADVVFVTGGYVTVPVALAAWRQHIPVMIYLPDLEPGWAVRFMSRFADRIAVSFDQVCRFFDRRKVWVSGYPVRAELFKADRQAGRRILGLDARLKTLLVFGGSRGARSINQALVAILPDLLAEYQVVHISGELDWPWVMEQQTQLSRNLAEHYHPYPYLHEELVAAFVAADLVVARAGAATLAEFPAAGLPSILVPYPYSGQHQQKNADFMVAQGAAVCVQDRDLGTQLRPMVQSLLQDATRLADMKMRAHELSQPDAAYKLAAELERLAHAV